MPENIKNQQEILKKLSIEKLNPMQEEAYRIIPSHKDTILLSPTGTGKTLAYTLPIIEDLDNSCPEIQVLILVPSRELAMQIEQVIRQMGTGHKVNAVYGGRAGSQDKIDLKHRPAILIGTPGRVADRFRRDHINLENIKTLVLDEFDKSLEIGFEEDMKEIISTLPNVEKRILTSATHDIKIPEFVDLQAPKTINYLSQANTKLTLKSILSPDKDKLNTLVEALCHLGNQPGIIFCNFKDSIQRVSEYLNQHNISHGCFHGGMEQKDRERALVKFRNGTHQLIVATDLAARGLDIPEIKFIIHYHLPANHKEFTHRNGRTARMKSDGTAYILRWKEEELPEFAYENSTEQFEELTKASAPNPSIWTTLYLTGGRRDKISKGDIAGLFFKQAKLTKEELGIIEIKPECAFVSILKTKAKETIKLTNNTKLKKKKIRVSEI